MIRYIMLKSVNERGLIGIGFCILLFVFGYFVLDYTKTMEDPPLVDTIYILIGSAFTIISGLGIILILKYLYDYKKKKERRERKRRKHNLFYLKDSKKKQL